MPSASSRLDYLRALCRAVPHPIVERVLAAPTEMSVGGQRFEGSVLSADLVGFTSLCERAAAAGPESLSRLTRLLSKLFAQLLEGAVFPHEGWVVQFGGDSLTVLFRGPTAGQRAAAAALAMQRTIRGESTEGITDQPGDLQLRVGIATGVIELSMIGDFTQRVVVSSGVAVHRAVRLQARAAPGTARVDDVTSAVLLHAGAEPVLRAHAEDDQELISLGKPPAETAPVPYDSLLETTDVEASIALLEPFVPTVLSSRLKSAPSGWRMEGELRPVVIVFLEVSRFDSPGRSRDWQIGVSRSLTRAFRKYGGIVAKADASENGHRVMVLFGLHLPSGNDAERALLASLEAMARVRAFLAHDPDGATASAGVHTGTVYFGTFGSDARHDTTVVGDAVNTAARTAHAAQPFEVLATEETVQEAPGIFQTTPRAPLRVKGKADPLILHAVHAPKEGTAHYARQRTQQRELAGRKAEVERALELVKLARSGAGQVVGLCGEEGSGKSALLSRIIDAWVESGGVALVGRCRYANRGEPLAPVVAMFSSFLGITASDSESQRRERIRSGLKPFGILEDADEFLSLLEPVRRPDGQRESLIELTDAYARERVLATILRFLDQRLNDEPMLYVVEDLHLSDSLTLDMLLRALSLNRQRPFMLVTTYRPEPLLTTFRRALEPHQELTLPPLDASGVEAVVATQLQAKSVDPQLLAFLVERTHGNPSHTVDMVRFLAQRALVRVRGDVVVSGEGGLTLLDDVVPRGATHVALALLDQLGEVERRLARTASVIGRSFSQSMLEQISASELDRGRVHGALESLEGQAVLAPETHSGGYSFRDDVTRAVAYGTLPEGKRQEIHRRVAEALSLRPDFDLSRDAAPLANHFDRASRPAEAARWYAIAAEAALRAGLAEEARHRVSRWERCVRQTEASFPADESARMKLVKVVSLGLLRLSGEVMAAVDALSPGELAQLSQVERAVIQFWRGQTLARLGQQEKARAAMVPVYEAADDPALRRDAALEIAYSLVSEGRAPQALLWLGRAEALVGSDPAALQRIELVRTEVLASRGGKDAVRARERFLELAADARRGRRLELVAHGLQRAAQVDLSLGRLEVARDEARQSLALHRVLGRWLDVAADQLLLGETLLWAGAASEAREVLEAALATAKEAGDQLLTAAATTHLGAAIALTRDPPEGARLCEEGEQLARRAGLPNVLHAAHLHLLQIAKLREDGKELARWRAECEADQPHYVAPLLRERLAALNGASSPAAPAK